MIRLGINGFGRIGRQVLKAVLSRYPESLQVAAVNDLFDVATNAHLFKYDTNYGRWAGEVSVRKDSFIIDGRPIRSLAFRDPVSIPWDDEGVDIVIESTGLFLTGPKAAAHLQAGAKKVIITAPAKEEDLTVVMGVNHKNYRPKKHHIVSNASCTTNCLAPVAKVILDKFGIRRGLMTTVHSYTNDQRILDFPHSDLRRARAAALSMIPTKTGAASAVALVIPELKGKFDGLAVRVPTPNVSLVDLVMELEQETTVQEVNKTLKDSTNRYLGYTDEPLVSIDFQGDPHSAVVDGQSTKVIGPMAKVLAWYDNEWGYSNRVLDLILHMDKEKPV